MGWQDHDSPHPAQAFAKVSKGVAALGRLTSRIKDHEGLCLKIYDDKTGKPVVPGQILRGIPTIGYGRNLLTRGLTKHEAEFLLEGDIDRCAAEVSATWPWVANLNEARWSVMVESVFQLGLEGFKKFVTTLGHIEAGRYAEASESMLDSLWAKQTPKRVERLALILKTGAWE